MSRKQGVEATAYMEAEFTDDGTVSVTSLHALEKLLPESLTGDSTLSKMP